MSSLKLWWLVRDYDIDSGKFAQWRYISHDNWRHITDSQIRTEFEERYGYRPAVVRKVSPTGRQWLVGPIQRRKNGLAK